MSVDIAEAAAVEILNGLVDFFGGVHHKGAVTDYRLVDRLAREQQDFDFVAAGLQAHFAFAVFKDRQLAGSGAVFAVHQHFAAQDHQRQVVAGGYAQHGFFVRADDHVPHSWR